MHGVQVVDEGLHGLIGGPVGLLHRPLVGELLTFLRLDLVQAEALHEPGPLGVEPGAAVLQLGIQAGLLLQFRQLGLHLALRVLFHPAQEHQGPGQVLPVEPPEGLGHALGHAVVEVRDGLAAVLVVLVGLDGDAGQGGVGVDVVGLPQGAVAGGEAAVEQANHVDLGAGGGARVEVHVVDVDVPLLVGPGVLGLHHPHHVELLGPLAAVLEHGAHGGVAVDVGVLPLDVAVLGGGEGDVLIDPHEPAVQIPDLAALLAVEDVGSGGLDIAAVHKHPLHDVLDVLHVGGGLALYLQDGGHLMGQGGGSLVIAGLVGGLEGLVDGVGDLFLVEGDHPSVSFPNLLYHRHGGFTSLKSIRTVSSSLNLVSIYCGLELY